jgi:hypothetical protein
MPWCPRCENEYPPGSDACWVCKSKLIDTNPADIRAEIARTRGEPLPGWQQVPLIWFTAFGVVVVAYSLGGVLEGVWGPLAVAVAILAPLAVIFGFGAGYLFESLFTLPYIWLGWFLVGVPILALACYAAAFVDYRGGVGRLAVLALVMLPSLGAGLTSCGVKYARTRHWAYILLSIILAGGETAGISVLGV